MPGKAPSNPLEEMTESQKFSERSPSVHSLDPHRPSCLLNPVGFLLLNLTALPKNCSDHALVGRTATAAPKSGAGQVVPCLAQSTTPTAPDTAGNLTDSDKPTERWQLLGQVTRKQP